MSMQTPVNTLKRTWEGPQASGIHPNKRGRSIPPHGMDGCGCGGWKKVEYPQCAGCRQRQKQPCTGGCNGCRGWKIAGYDWCANCWPVKKQEAEQAKELMKTLAAMFKWCACRNGVIVAGKGMCQGCLDEFDKKKRVCGHCHTRQFIVHASDMCYACKDAHVESLGEEERESFLLKLEADQDELLRKEILRTCAPLM